MAYSIGAFISQFLIAIAFGYIFAFVAKLAKAAPNKQFGSAVVGVLLASGITLSRDEIDTWIAAVLACAFLYWRSRQKPATPSK